MGCSSGRGDHQKDSIDELAELETLPVSSEEADKVIRKYAPSPFISPLQLDRIVKKLAFPISPIREAFYKSMALPDGYIRHHFLVATIMQGRGSSRLKLKLLFEVMDEHYQGVVPRDMVVILAQTMVIVTFTYPCQVLPATHPLYSDLSTARDNIDRIIIRLREKIAVGLSVALHDMTNLSTEKNWKDIGSSRGFRRFASFVLENSDLSAAVPKSVSEEEGKTPLESTDKPRRVRKRQLTERGKQTSEYIRNRTLRVGDSVPYPEPLKSITPGKRLSPSYFRSETKSPFTS